jgi:hypothetical protein
VAVELKSVGEVTRSWEVPARTPVVLGGQI